MMVYRMCHFLNHLRVHAGPIVTSGKYPGIKGDCGHALRLSLKAPGEVVKTQGQHSVSLCPVHPSNNMYVLAEMIGM